MYKDAEIEEIEKRINEYSNKIKELDTDKELTEEEKHKKGMEYRREIKALRKQRDELFFED